MSLIARVRIDCSQRQVYLKRADRLIRKYRQNKTNKIKNRGFEQNTIGMQQ